MKLLARGLPDAYTAKPRSVWEPAGWRQGRQDGASTGVVTVVRYDSGWDGTG